MAMPIGASAPPSYPPLFRTTTMVICKNLPSCIPSTVPYLPLFSSSISSLPNSSLGTIAVNGAKRACSTHSRTVRVVLGRTHQAIRAAVVTEEVSGASGFFLNPRFQYEEGFVYIDNIRSGVTKVIERLAPNVTFAIEATREIAQFRGKIGRFGDLTAQTAVGIMNPVNSSRGVENLVIIGSGPAGYTAAIYAARANLKPVVFEGYQVGGVPGGQLMTTTEVENFPGFPDGITGPDLMDRMRRQAERWGAELFQEDVEYIDLRNGPFTVRSTEREVRCHSVIVATGANAQRLRLPREDEFWSRGISACAICDGASPLFKGQVLAVVGGGDTATEEALYLTKYARHVHLLVRRDQLRASKAMQDRVYNNPNITVHFNTEAVDVTSNNKGQMSGILLRRIDTGEESILEVKGLFYGIGHRPNSDLLEGQVELDGSGYVLVEEGTAKTSVQGVFAAGDVQDHEWRQAITAAGSGCVAALSVERYLVSNNLLIEFHQPKTEEMKKELEDRDVQMGFDITLTKHKGQYALRKLYHESPRLICVLYTAPTCGPCRTLKPILSKVIDEFDENVHFVEIDIEEDQEVAEAAGIMGTPCVQFFKNKEMLRNIPGVKMKKEYREFIGTNK